jgi:uncharacterized glyoxalase superfamily protein PhnB
MKMTKLTPMLTVANMDESIRFYRELLGFECVSHMEGWAALRNGEVEIMVALPNAHLPFERSQFTGSFYFHPEDVDALWQQLKDKTTVVYPIENFFYGMREFAIRDNNGYMLQFGQPIEDPSQIPPKAD